MKKWINIYKDDLENLTISRKSYDTEKDAIEHRNLERDYVRTIEVEVEE